MSKSSFEQKIEQRFLRDRTPARSTGIRKAEVGKAIALCPAFGPAHEPFKAIRFQDGLLRSNGCRFAHLVQCKQQFSCLGEPCAELVPHAVRLRRRIPWPED